MDMYVNVNLVGYCAVMGQTSHAKSEANRFTLRGGASDLNMHFVYFYILCPSLGFLT